VVFGVDTETDWKVGSPLVHRGVYQGRPYQDKGEIIDSTPTVLAHTHWSDLSGKPDGPDHHQQVTWTLSSHDGATERTITETNGGEGGLRDQLEHRPVASGGPGGA
jgi:hypothetical protein